MAQEESLHSFFMQEAIKEAEKARLIAPPNPWVGAVLVKDNTIIAHGHTHPPGSKHAEIHALQNAGEQAKGSTLFVTLEPCCHQGRSGPCTRALIEAGVKKVFVSLLDPDHHVSGKGVQILKNAGIEVHVGLESERVKKQLKSYLFHRTHGLPYTVLKAAVSLDGRIAAADESSQWISGEEARKDCHILRSQSQAILIGANTAIKDQPSLTVRYGIPCPNPPLRIVLDPHGRVPPTGPLADQGLGKTLLITKQDFFEKVQEKWSCAEVLMGPQTEKEVFDLKKVLKILGERGILQVMVEGGASVFQSFFQESLAQELQAYVGPRILGFNGKSLFGELDFPCIEKAPILNLIETERLGNTLKINYSL